MKSMGVGRERACFGGIWIWMRAYQQWRRREEKGEGEMRGNRREKRIGGKQFPPMALPIALHKCIAIALHCVALH